MALLRLLALGASLAILLAAPEASAQRRRESASGTLVVTSGQEGAEVLIDEEAVGTTPVAPLRLAPGMHTLRVRLPGHTEHTDVVEITAGRRVEVEVELIALSFVLTVETVPPGAHVYVDGDFRGETPVEVELLEGTRALRVALPGHRESERQIVATAGQRDTLALTLEPLPGDALSGGGVWYEDPVTWIVLGGGAAAIAAAVVIGVVVSGASSAGAVDAFCAQPGGCVRLVPSW